MIDAITTLADVPRNRAPLAMIGSVPHGAGTHRADGTALPRGVGLGACGTSADPGDHPARACEFAWLRWTAVRALRARPWDAVTLRVTGSRCDSSPA